MKILINTDDLKKMLNSIKKCISKDERLLKFKNIKVESKNNMVKLIACDGFKLAIYECKAIEADEFECIIPYFIVPKNASMTTEINLKEDKISINFGCYEISYDIFKGDFFNYTDIVDDKKYNFKIGFNSNYLKELFSSSPDNNVELNINIFDRTSPMLIKNIDNNNFKAACLPIRLSIEKDMEIKNALNFEKTVPTCLHCGKDTPLYCEKCHQDLIGRNAKSQTELQRQYNTGYLAGIMHADLDWKDLIKDEIKDYKRMRGASNFFNSEISILEKLLKKGE